MKSVGDGRHTFAHSHSCQECRPLVPIDYCRIECLVHVYYCSGTVAILRQMANIIAVGGFLQIRVLNK